MSKIELGVFMPVGNHGWIFSKNSPNYKPTFELNKTVAQLAESIGFDFIFSMAKWRGFGGDVEFWKYTLESLVLMSGLAAITQKMRLITSVAPAIIHPAVYAKMAATLDDISAGRMSINLVHAGNPAEYVQMGLYPENYDSYRYEYTEEWLEVIKRLWTEEKVTFQGKHFTLTDCESFPKPIQSLPSVVYATSSQFGYDFVGKSCDVAFIGGSSIEQMIETSLKFKEVAQQRYGRKIRTQTTVNLILASSDAEAKEILQYYWEGADLSTINAVRSQRKGFSVGLTLNELRKKGEEGDYSSLFYAGYHLVGGPESVVDFIENLAVNGQYDALSFMFPDFVQGTKDFGKMVMPLLRERKLLMNLGMG